MRIYCVCQGFWYEYYDTVINKAQNFCMEINDYPYDTTYATGFQLDEIRFSFQNPETMKSRVRPRYIPVCDVNGELSLRAIIYEIPITEDELVHVSEEECHNNMARAILRVIQSQNVPTAIRKQFARERFIADIRDFFVNEKGCKL